MDINQYLLARLIKDLSDNEIKLLDQQSQDSKYLSQLFASYQPQIEQYIREFKRIKI